MLIVFIFSLLVLLYIFIGYPLILAALSLLLGKEINKKEYYPSVSLIISVYNEEKVIREKIENSLQLDYPREQLEIIIASESTDRTNEIVKQYEKQGVVLYAYDKREGKRVTLYKTVPLAKGEIVVFSDANGSYRKDAIKKIVRNFFDRRIGCVSGKLILTNPKESSIGEGETAYWEIDSILKIMASRMFSLGGCGGVTGSIFAIRKELYDPIDEHRGDDFEISCRVELNGYGVVMEPEAISYEEPSENSNQEFNRKVRLISWNFKSSLLLLTEALQRGKILTAFLLFSHRFLRYTTPIWMILLLISNIFNLKINFLLYFVYIQIIFYACAVIGWIMEKRDVKSKFIFLLPFYFCMANLAALRAMSNLILKREKAIWEKIR